MIGFLVIYVCIRWRTTLYSPLSRSILGWLGFRQWIGIFTTIRYEGRFAVYNRLWLNTAKTIHSLLSQCSSIKQGEWREALVSNWVDRRGAYQAQRALIRWFTAFTFFASTTLLARKNDFPTPTQKTSPTPPVYTFVICQGINTSWQQLIFQPEKKWILKPLTPANIGTIPKGKGILYTSPLTGESSGLLKRGWDRDSRWKMAGGRVAINR